MESTSIIITVDITYFTFRLVYKWHVVSFKLKYSGCTNYSDDIDGLDFLNKGLASMASAMMNAGAFVFDEQETERGEGHGRKRELTREGMHIKVSAVKPLNQEPLWQN